MLHVVTGGGDVGDALVRDPRIMGVAFTGSTGTARRIARALLDDESRPLVPLIAETGGINAMIVDSTALTEQVVQDVITSAFRSAGQRCSALRLLLVQEDVADRTLEMLTGAMDTLVVGDPADPATDVGPVIDSAAYEKLEAYRRSQQSRWLHAVPAPETGDFIAPTIIRLDTHRRSDRRMVRAAAACRDLEGRRAAADDRGGQLSRLWPDHGPAQPHRQRRRRRRPRRRMSATSTSTAR